MKKLFTSITVLHFISCLLIPPSSAQIALNEKQTSISLLSGDDTESIIKFEFGLMNQEHVSTPKGDAVIISIDQGTPLLQAGNPDLPKVVTSLIIPDDKDMEVTITSAHYADYTNINIAPSKGTLLRNIEPSAIPYSYNNDVYEADIFYPKDLAQLREPYILRDYRGQTVIVHPFQYNAVTKSLRVYSDITIKISPKNSGSLINAFIRNKPLEKVQTEFSHIYDNQFLNYTANTSRYISLEDHGDMLIISDAGFMDEMQPFVDWKIQEGIKTEMVDVATVGNDAASIKNYVTDYYNTHGLTFLLLAGDDAQVATGFVSGAGDSDNQYGYITGSDHYQEIFVGRFSATTGSDITTQVDRTIEYEKNPLVDSYYAKGVCIASEFGAGIGDDGEADYDHERNIRDQLLGYTYTDIQELYDKDHPGGNDASGNPGSADLADLVNSGTGIINYTGHGSETSIVTTGFDNNDVNDLTNVHHWPFLWIVGCVTGDFKNTTCFAEAWARATYNDEPSGSVANFMSTVNQYWAEPMEMQDEGNNILAEAEADNIKRTFGGLSINGCFSMNDAYGQSGYDMTDTWTIFGDPSLMIRTAEPASMNITHDLQIVEGSVQFEVNCDFDGALVSITRNNIILGTGNVSGGIAAVQFENILANVDSVVITVTGFNKLPYIMIIPAIQAAGPVLVNTASTINDALGNNNGKADYNEVVSMDITVENVGSATAENVTANLASINPSISFTDDAETFGDITSGAVDDQSAAFSFTVAGNVPDATMADFILTLADDSSGVWTSGITVLLNAPVLAVTSFSIDDASGNNDGKLDPSETVTLNISNSNTGHADAQNTTGILTSSNPYITIYNSNYSIGNLIAASTYTAAYSVSVDANTPFGTDVSFAYTVTAGSYSAALNFISTVTPAIEDFETSDFSQFDWQLSGDEVWKTESYDVFEGTYSAHSGNLSSNQSSILTIALNVISDDDISFMMKVSSEPNYDSLTFSIDNVSMGNWSGTIDWSAQTFPVTEGNHTFTWKYQKDGAVNIGYDCAYLDNIFLPAFQSAVNISSANASVDICSYPNPFSQLTFIDYTVKSISDVSVHVFDLNGRLVKTILSNELQVPGQYHLGFDGSSLANGNYYCTITMGDKTFTEKLVLNK